MSKKKNYKIRLLDLTLLSLHKVLGQQNKVCTVCIQNETLCGINSKGYENINNIQYEHY